MTFNLDKTYSGNAKFTASIAGVSNSPKITVGVNGSNKGSWSLKDDGSLRRSATQAGRHRVESVTFPASSLKVGANKLTLTASSCKSGTGVLYDCIKLEAGVLVTSGIEAVESEAGAATFEVFTVGGVKVGDFDSLDGLNLEKGIYIYRSGSKTGKIIF